jgi:hypothetical protein
MERVAGIEPACAAWKAAVLPLNYTRVICEILSQSYLNDHPSEHQGPFAGSFWKFFSPVSISLYSWTSCLLPCFIHFPLFPFPFYKEAFGCNETKRSTCRFRRRSPWHPRLRSSFRHEFALRGKKLCLFGLFL